MLAIAFAFLVPLVAKIAVTSVTAIFLFHYLFHFLKATDMLSSNYQIPEIG